MITEPEEFRQQLLEIQNSIDITYSTLPSDEPRFIIDANSRTITIPHEFGFIGVKNDHKAENIYFEIDRYFDHEDLSNHTCIVQYSYKGFEGIYPVTSLDIESIDGKILFCWTIMNDATRDFGNINFSVRFYSIENNEYTYNFNTLTASSKILDTLDVSRYPYDSPTPEQFQIYIDKTNEISEKMDNFTTTVTESEQNAFMYAEEAKLAYEGTEIQIQTISEISQQSIDEIKNESDTQITNMQNEAIKTLNQINTVYETIPRDYSNLSNEVTTLKNNFEEYLPFKFGIDDSGNYGYYKRGADTVTPFNSGGDAVKKIFCRDAVKKIFCRDAVKKIFCRDAVLSYETVENNATQTPTL